VFDAVSVDIVSRFRSAKKIKAVQESILLEKNDILIGTHSLLNNDIYLKNIGLLVIDEEHRFGVQQKEKIKCFKEGVDVLSMSATPIPRSLNLALSGIYSISLLQSPPLMRMPIITRVDYFRDELLRDAISFEVDRGGQVYFVHNDIQSIKHITERIRGLFPLLQVMFIHGQESPSEVERKMGLFISATVSVLVCTSIIEAGIDVPNANCIIINNSHLFGLSQLYQIRGRVGRSHRQAYAYLVIPQRLTLSTKAFYRIKTIEENTRLGSGYNISRSEACIFLNCFYSVKSLS
jgi:transcription-repair coupling factor (superfamily II helicase)